MTETISKRRTNATLVGAVVAAFIASACCILPAVLALIGLSGVGLAAALAPYRPWFLAGTAVLLAASFYLVYGRRRAAETSANADDCGCEAPRAARSGKAMLWVATLMVVGFAAYPYVAGAVATTSKAGAAAPVDRAVTASIRISGMDCEGCVTGIVDDLAAVPGVIDAQVSYENRRAVVTYDPEVVRPERLVAAVSALGYPAELEPVGLQ